MKPRLGKARDHLLHAGERVAEVRQVAGARTPCSQPAGEPFQVADTVERGAQSRARVDPVQELLERVEPGTERTQIAEWIEEPLPEPSRPHRRLRLVQHPEERAAPLARERLQELEVPPRGGVEAEEAREGVRLGRTQVRGPAAVDRVDVGERPAGGSRCERRQRRFDGSVGERGRRPRPPVGTRRGDRRRQVGGEQELARRESLELITGHVPSLGFRGPDGAGGEVDHPEAEARPVTDERGKETRDARVEALLLEDRPGRDDPDDLPFEEAPAALGCLRLLADRHRVAGGEEPRDVRLRGVDGKAAERNLVGVAAVPRRERQVERPRRDLGVVEEHLVEVAEAKKEDRPLVLCLDAGVLREKRALSPAGLPLRPARPHGRHLPQRGFPGKSGAAAEPSRRRAHYCFSFSSRPFNPFSRFSSLFSFFSTRFSLCSTEASPIRICSSALFTCSKAVFRWPP